MYENQGIERRTCSTLAFCVTLSIAIVGVFAFAVCLYWIPYQDFLKLQYKKHDAANATVHSDLCTHARARAAVEVFGTCPNAELVLRDSAEKAAFYDLMAHLNVCNDGRCSRYLSTFAYCFAIVLGIILAFASCNIMLLSFGRYTASYQLPFTDPNQQQFYAALAMAAAQQQRKKIE